MTKIRIRLAILIILCSTVTALLPGVARAAVTFALSPASGIPGSLVNVTISRTPPATYGPNTSFWLYWDAISSDSFLASTRVADAITSFTMVFRVPESARGTHSVILYDGANQFSQPFSVTSSVTATPTAAAVGAEVSVTGAGFVSSETGVTITFIIFPFDGTSVKTGISADSRGTWRASFTVPEAPRGNHLVGAFGPSSVVGEVPYARISVVPSITIVPAAPGVGAEVSVTGTGFVAGERGIVVTLDGAPLKTGISADSRGTWRTSFALPEIASGNHVIDAAGESTPAGDVLDVSFNATPRIAVSPVAPGVGTEVSVTGTGFAAGERGIAVTLDGAPVKTGISADAKGTWRTSFIVPEAARGNHVIDASGESTPAGNVPDVSFNATPRIAVSPVAPGVGAEVSVTGAGFAAGERGIVVTLDGAPLKTGISADAKGTWRTSFTVPEAARGNHVVGASGPSSAVREVPGARLSVVPLITIVPVAPGAGAVVSTTGTGFAAGERGIAVTLDGAPLKTGIAADAKGTWRTSFIVPEAARGNHVIDASGEITPAGDVPDASFTLAPSVKLSGQSGYAGDTITVTGNAFAPSETGIRITFGNIIAKDNISADASGYWTTQITIPPGVRGNHAIGAYGPSTSAAEVTNVTFATISRLMLNPAEAHVGAKITAIGNGFSENQVLTVEYDSITVLSSVTTTGEGIFFATFTVPKSMHGRHTVTASDEGGATAQATFMMESTPPPVPGPVSPEGRVGGFASRAKVSFDWQDVPDPSGVSYTLEISWDASFTTKIVARTDLTESWYELSPEEALPQGNYYWRVKAVDGAANDSGWSAPQQFQVGLAALLMVLWMFIVIVAVILLVVFIRRSRYM